MILKIGLDRPVQPIQSESNLNPIRLLVKIENERKTKQTIQNCQFNRHNRKPVQLNWF